MCEQPTDALGDGQLPQTQGTGWRWADDLLGRWSAASLEFVRNLVSRLATLWSGGCIDDVIPQTKRRGHVLLLVFVLAQALLMPLLLTGWMLWIPAVGVSLIAFSLAQFLADRFIVEGEKLLTTGSAHVNNMALLDIIGLISVAAGCAAMGVGVYLAADGAGRSSQMLAGLLVLSLGSLAIPFAVFAFCPHLVGVTTSSNASAGDEAIGLLSFAIRSSLALASFWYLFVGVWSLVGLLLAVVVSIDSGAVASTVFGATVLAMLAGAVLPLLLYVSYLMLALGVDLVRAFLNIRQNVEALAERRAAD